VNRRDWIKGAAGLLVAPAIVRAESIMRVRPVTPALAWWGYDLAAPLGDSVVQRVFFYPYDAPWQPAATPAWLGRTGRLHLLAGAHHVADRDHGTAGRGHRHLERDRDTSLAPDADLGLIRRGRAEARRGEQHDQLHGELLHKTVDTSPVT